MTMVQQLGLFIGGRSVRQAHCIAISTTQISPISMETYQVNGIRSTLEIATYPFHTIPFIGQNTRQLCETFSTNHHFSSILLGSHI
jgi:hypothetical protein